jgi:hypothetical protein
VLKSLVWSNCLAFFEGPRLGPVLENFRTQEPWSMDQTTKNCKKPEKTDPNLSCTEYIKIGLDI